MSDQANVKRKSFVWKPTNAQPFTQVIKRSGIVPKREKSFLKGQARLASCAVSFGFRGELKLVCVSRWSRDSWWSCKHWYSYGVLIEGIFLIEWRGPPPDAKARTRTGRNMEEVGRDRASPERRRIERAWQRGTERERKREREREGGRERRKRKWWWDKREKRGSRTGVK